MSLIYVNGHPGVGKSTACRAMKKLGYKAYDIDQGLTRWVESETGKPVKIPDDVKKRTENWYTNHDYEISRSKLKKLKNQAKENNIYVFGHSRKDNDVIDLFDKIIFLKLDKQNLAKRLKERGQGFGETNDELRLIMKWHGELEELREKTGAIMIDSSTSINHTVQAILEAS